MGLKALVKSCLGMQNDEVYLGATDYSGRPTRNPTSTEVRRQAASETPNDTNVVVPSNKTFTRRPSRSSEAASDLLGHTQLSGTIPSDWEGGDECILDVRQQTQGATREGTLKVLRHMYVEEQVKEVVDAATARVKAQERTDFFNRKK